MAKPLFIFTQLRNSFRVHVANLEALSVAQIQEIEHFVKERKGLFDFESYTFLIQKKITFNEFVFLLEHLEISASCKEFIIEKEESTRISFGQYKGMCYFELPDSYLLWLLNNYRGREKEALMQEIKRRNLQ